MELQAIHTGGHGRAPSPKPVQEGQPQTPVREAAAQPTGTTSSRIPPNGRAEPHGIEHRLADAQERTHGRLASVIDEASLSPRQQQALEQVLAEFDQKLARLKGSAEGAEGLDGALQKVYGTLLDQLRDILGAGHAAPGEGRGPDASGLALDTHA